jgi:hypothetical protein
MLRYAREKVVSLMRFDAPFLILGGGGRDAIIVGTIVRSE